MEFVHELQEEAVIHISEIFDTEATKLFGLAHARPSHQAARTMALFLTSPEKGSMLGIESFHDLLWEQDRGHVVYGQATEHRVDQHNSSTSAK